MLQELFGHNIQIWIVVKIKLDENFVVCDDEKVDRCLRLPADIRASDWMVNFRHTSTVLDRKFLSRYWSCQSL